jgi:O-antigen biosynthesis protein
VSRPYVVSAPDYVSHSAGVKCLYRLCHELRLLGYKASVASGKTAPDFPVPLLTEKEARLACLDGAVAVYPEIVRGNPFGASTVARWVLNKPGYLDGDKVYDDRELVFSYSRAYDRHVSNRLAGHLHMPTIDRTIFFPPLSRRERVTELVYAGKSTVVAGVAPSCAVAVGRATPPKALLGDLFRSAKRLWCFDNSTVVMYEAVLCGCLVVLVPDGSQSREDFERSELGLDGVAWGSEELARAESTLDPVETSRKLTSAETAFRGQLNWFAQTTQS